jgi:hypothetical protein
METPDFLSQLDEIASPYGLYGEGEQPTERRQVTAGDIRVVCSQIQLPEEA